MLITPERAGLIRRQPGVARSIQLLIDPGILPPLLPGHSQPVKTAFHLTDGWHLSVWMR
jgi:hypothetical protein